VKRNVEIKARVRDAEAFAERARKIAGRDPELIPQADIFFAAPRGRLKLRRLGARRGELIYYERDDAAGPGTSAYDIFRTEDPDGLQKALTRALGVRGEVRKTRRLYMSGRTRIHLDEVEGLGVFMELEVVLEGGEDPIAGEAEARALMRELGIAEPDLVESAYIDLLER